MKQLDRRLRIIGGNWRGRKVRFPESDDLRPTSDRVRETLFNWLMHEVHGARVLDLYAGSGILGIESLSRGAAHVTFVDNTKRAIEAIGRTLSDLNADENNYTLAPLDAINFITACKDSFDIIFLDPPFQSADIQKLTGLIADQALADEWVYIETGETVTAAELPDGFSIYRQKRAGTVHYCLCTSPSV